MSSLSGWVSPFGDAAEKSGWRIVTEQVIKLTLDLEVGAVGGVCLESKGPRRNNFAF